MYRALEIPEIVDGIVAEVRDIFTSRRADLVALARTCRAFQNPALDRIWRSQDTLSHLVRCLPRDLWDETTISREPVSARILYSFDLADILYLANSSGYRPHRHGTIFHVLRSN
ncbi:hypothetical protein B0H17DRAFT_963456 [Mycena rosella]|uniref:F-box domain-containing protein n=1 Tax=Mycena rosella TaxID=1033263 RepID=A0AAD7BPD9_MYCRO|nr:hypothetical protein B0H17DRAFT_963456 [Mycena rosella]